MKPDGREYSSDPSSLRDAWTQSGLSQREAATRLGINYRSLKFQLAGQRKIPYLVQFGMDCLAEVQVENDGDRHRVSRDDRIINCRLCQ